MMQEYIENSKAPWYPDLVLRMFQEGSSLQTTTYKEAAISAERLAKVLDFPVKGLRKILDEYVVLNQLVKLNSGDYSINTKIFTSLITQGSFVSIRTRFYDDGEFPFFSYKGKDGSYYRGFDKVEHKSEKVFSNLFDLCFSEDVLNELRKHQ